MKNTTIASLLLLVLGISGIAGIAVSLFTLYGNPNAPAPISVQAMTEKSIKKEAKYERKLRAYHRATVAARNTYRRLGCNPQYADLTGQIAVDFELSPRLLAGVVFVESSCRPSVVSERGSVGLTGVNARVWHYTRAELKNPRRNLEAGARILSAYIRMFGVVEGLHRYNGLGNHTNSYAAKVYTAAGFKIDFSTEGAS